MTARSRLRASAWALGAVTILAAGACSSGLPESKVTVAETVADEDPAFAAAAEPSTTAEPPAWSGPSPTTSTGVSTTGVFVACDDVPLLESTVEGNVSGTQNPDDELVRVIRDYGETHAGTFAGLWIDRAYGGALVAAFTDGLEAHRDTLAALLPQGTRFDVVQADYSYQELEAVRAELQSKVQELDRMSQFGIGTERNRVEVGFIDPPDGTLGRLAELVPTALVCVDVAFSPEPLSEPLDIVALLSAEDPFVNCRGIGSVRLSRLTDPTSIDEFDHPAVELLRGELRSLGLERLPTGDWSVLRDWEDRVTFAIVDGDVIVGHASFRPQRDRWALAGFSRTARPCEARLTLPGLAHVEVHLDPRLLPGPADTSIEMLVNEIVCSGGREIGDVLHGPQVIESDDSVFVAFAVVPITTSAATCLGNSFTRVTVELSRPLGERALLDGVRVPPSPIEVRLDR